MMGFNILVFVIGAWTGGMLTAVCIALVSMNRTSEDDRHGY